MTLTTADPAAAVCAYLASAISTVLATVTAPGATTSGPAIFRPDMPQWMDKTMPVAAIVVRPAGGYKMFGTGPLPVTDPVLDMICYGGGQQQSYTVAAAAAQALRALRMSVWEGATVYWARIAAGPVPLPDAATYWPATWLSAQVMVSENATA